MASDIFYSMTNKGFSAASILMETNSKLCQRLPVNLFLAAAFLELNDDQKFVTVYNCGQPDLLLFEGD